MSTEKLSELSKPVGFIEQSGMDYLRSGADADIWPDGGCGDDIPLYSQEYVSALLARIAELEAKDQAHWVPDDSVICNFCCKECAESDLKFTLCESCSASL